MAVRKGTSDWQCINCGSILGTVLGGEFHPSVAGKQLRTSGPNLVVTCPECGSVKTFYTADPVVRALYQLINAVSAEAAAATMREIGRYRNDSTKNP